MAIPIDGVGIQMHIGTRNDTPTAADDRLAALGLQAVISATDINGCDGLTSDNLATTCHDIVALCVSQLLCASAAFCGISDPSSWLDGFGEAGCKGTSPTPVLWGNACRKKTTHASVIKAPTDN